MSEAAQGSAAATTTTAEVSPNAPGAKVDSVPTESKEAAAAAVERYKLKVNGAEVEATLDDLKRGFSLGQGSHQRFQEAAAMMKKAGAMMAKVTEFQQMLQDNPELALKQANRSKLRPVMEKMLADDLKLEMMSPEERQAYLERKEKDAKLSEYEKKEKEAEENKKTAEFERMLSEQRTAYETKFIEAFKRQNWPADTNMVTKLMFMRDMATLLEAAVSSGYEPSDDELATMARDNFMSQASQFFGSVPDDALEAVLPPNLAKRLRKRDLAKLRGAGVQIPKEANGDGSHIQEKPTAKMSREDWQRAIHKRAGLDA